MEFCNCDAALFTWKQGGCNEGAATPRWGCICCPKTVRQWLNEWGLNVIVMHRDNSPFIQLKMWRPLSSAEGKRWGEEKATAIQNHNLDSLFCFLRACGERRGGLLCPPGFKALQCTRLFLHRCVKKGPHKKKNMERKMRLEPQHGARRIPATTRVRMLNKGFWVQASVDLSV